MGWLKLNRTGTDIVAACWNAKADHKSQTDKSNSEHIENIDQQDAYPFQPVTLPDTSLPFIAAEVVSASKSQPDRLWIVVDNIVYNCTDFVSEHPGGRTVIQSFHGEDCTWQFWRFHNRTHMWGTGRPLRIGRTAGVTNRFKERPKFVGLKRLGDESD